MPTRTMLWGRWAAVLGLTLSFTTGCTCGTRFGSDAGDLPGFDGAMPGSDSGTLPGDDATVGPGDLFNLPSGTVMIFETKFIDDPFGPLDAAIVSAYFGVNVLDWCESLVVDAAAGGCCIGRSSLSAAGPDPSIDHGTVTITGLPAISPFVMTPPNYFQPLAIADIFSGGEIVGIEIADVGGAPLYVEVPAPFELVTTVPNSAAPGSTITVDPTQDFPITWVAGTADEIVIQLYENGEDAAGNMNPDAEYIGCRATDTGSFSIPASLVAELDFHPINLGIWRRNYEERTVGTESLGFMVSSTVFTFEGF